MATIRWHGQSCFEVAHEGFTVVTDPHDGKSIGLPAPRARAQVVLKSHDHFDHNCVRQVAGPATSLYAGGLPYRFNGFSARSVPGHHDAQGGAKLGEVQIMVFELGGLRFCHLSDIGHVPTPAQVGAIGPVDVLFVPTGGVFTIGAEGAWKTIEAIEPAVAVPMHYRFGGLSVSIQDLQPFLDLVPAGREVIRVGNEVDLEGREDLPEQGAVWVFSL
jgi:L-ascorbate metabolism protein UlaG (beta-lactamase superfamily)